MLLPLSNLQDRGHCHETHVVTPRMEDTWVKGVVRIMANKAFMRSNGRP